ncbi:hypothetical protein WJX74_008470 [Apatococcus lobatus]|uniref:Carrier domain-containing protein n=1 Tax=Apatococcus lobatus TaxID=904363 RepID=A0AAW1QC41_9CHLO
MSLWSRLRQTVPESQAALWQLAAAGLVKTPHQVLLPQVCHLAACISADVPSKPHLVAIYLSRSTAYIICVLACLELGAALLPLDPAQSGGHMKHLLLSLCPDIIIWASPDITGGAGFPPADVLTEAGVQAFQLPDEGSLGSPESAQIAKWPVDEEGGLMPGGSHGVASAEEQSPGYVMPTSGSTGLPIGVRGTQQGILNRCNWMQAAYPLKQQDVVAFSTSPCFVDSVWQIFGPLLAGCNTVIIPQDQAANPSAILSTLVQHRVTHFVSIPALLAAIARQLTPQSAAALSLKMVMSSGEPLTEALCRTLQAALGPAGTLLNLYGSAEGAADSSTGKCYGSIAAQSQQSDNGRAARCVPAGHPISNMAVIVVRQQDPTVFRHDQPAKASLTVSAADVGDVGEIIMLGEGLAAGYHRNETASCKSFRAMPASCLAGMTAPKAVLWGPDTQKRIAHAAQAGRDVRVFHSGDLGLIGPYGLEVKGRIDLCVKIRGVRVDLLEVESTLAVHPAVGAVAAFIVDLPAGPQLQACLELLQPLQPGHACSALKQSLRQSSQQSLPSAAVPSTFHFVCSIPRTPAGKLDRQALAAQHECKGDVPQRSPCFAAGMPTTADGHASSWASCAHFQPTTGLHAPAGDISRSSRITGTLTQQDAQQASQAPRSLGLSRGQAKVSELHVMRTFMQVLQQPQLEPTSDFFEWGGHSLAAAEVAATFGIQPALITAYPTARKLVKYLTSAQGRSQSYAAPNPHGTEPFMAQKWLASQQADLPVPKERVLQPNTFYPLDPGESGIDSSLAPHQPKQGGMLQPCCTHSSDPDQMDRSFSLAPHLNPAKRQKLQHTTVQLQRNDAKGGAHCQINSPSSHLHILQQDSLDQLQPAGNVGTQSSTHAPALNPDQQDRRQESHLHLQQPFQPHVHETSSRQQIASHDRGPRYPHWHHPDATCRPQPSYHGGEVLGAHGYSRGFQAAGAAITSQALSETTRYSANTADVTGAQSHLHGPISEGHAVMDNFKAEEQSDSMREHPSRQDADGETCRLHERAEHETSRGASSGCMKVIWRVPMRECVDASPLVLIQPASCQTSPPHGRPVRPGHVSMSPSLATPQLPPKSSPTQATAALGPVGLCPEMRVPTPAGSLIPPQAVSSSSHSLHCMEPQDLPVLASANPLQEMGTAATADSISHAVQLGKNDPGSSPHLMAHAQSSSPKLQQGLHSSMVPEHQSLQQSVGEDLHLSTPDVVSKTCTSLPVLGSAKPCPIAPAYPGHDRCQPILEHQAVRRQACRQPSRMGCWWAFACSHGGDVIAVDGASGELVWETRLASRLNAGIALSNDNLWLTVPGSHGENYFLDTSSGNVLGMLHAGSAIVAAPAVDPWDGHVWLGTHGKELLRIEASTQATCLEPGATSKLQNATFNILDRCSAGAAISTPTVFDAARRLAYVTTLEGRVLAFRPSTPSSPEQLAMQPDDPIAHADSPRVVKAAPDASRGAAAGSQPTTASTEDAAWGQADTGGYVPSGSAAHDMGAIMMRLVVADRAPEHTAARPRSAQMYRLQEGSSRTTCRLRLMWEQPLATPVLSAPGVDETHGLLIVALLDGSICAFSHRGESAWTTQLSGPIFVPIAMHVIQTPGERRQSLAAIVTPQQGSTAALDVLDGSLVAKGRDDVHHTAATAIVCPAGGQGLLSLSGRHLTLQRFDMPGNCSLPPSPSSWREPEVVPLALPGEVFSAPVINSNLALFGCRDDHLYCVQLS